MKKPKLISIVVGGVIVFLVAIEGIKLYSQHANANNGYSALNAQLTNNPSTSTNSNNSTASTANNSIQGYLFDSSNNVIFIQYTASNNGNVSGTFYGDYEDSNNNFKTFSSPISGIINSNSISITLTNTSKTYTGNVSGNTLSLAFPQSDGSIQNIQFQQGTLTDYNQDVSQLQNTVANDQATQQQIQQNNNLLNELTQLKSNINNDLQSINADEQSLKADIQSTAKDLTSEQNDLQTTAKDEQTVLNEKAGAFQTQSDAQQVSSDAQQVSSDVQQIESDNQQFSSDNNALQQAIASLESDAQQINATGNQIVQKGLGAYKPVQIASTVNTANAVMKNTSNQMESYTAESKQVLNQANADAKKAQNYSVE